MQVMRTNSIILFSKLPPVVVVICSVCCWRCLTSLHPYILTYCLNVLCAILHYVDMLHLFLPKIQSKFGFGSRNNYEIVLIIWCTRNQAEGRVVLEYQRCSSLLITTISRAVNATPAKRRSLSLYSRCRRLKWGSMWDCKWGQARPRQPWAWRYTFTGWHGTLWLSLCRRVGTRKAELGEGGLEMVCEKRKDSSLQMGKKGQLVTKSPVQPSWPRGRVPQWLDSFWPFPQNLSRTMLSIGNGHENNERGSSGQLLSPIDSVH